MWKFLGGCAALVSFVFFGELAFMRVTHSDPSGNASAAAGLLGLLVFVGAMYCAWMDQ